MADFSLSIYLSLSLSLYIYIYIYIYIQSSTDKLFRCITTLQFSQTLRMLKGGIETRSTLRQTWYPTARPTSIPCQLGNYKVLSCSVHLFTFYTLPDTRVLNSFEELCIMRAAAKNSFARVLTPMGSVVIHRQTVSLYHKSSVWLDTQDT